MLVPVPADTAQGFRLTGEHNYLNQGQHHTCRRVGALMTVPSSLQARSLQGKNPEMSGLAAPTQTELSSADGEVGTARVEL